MKSAFFKDIFREIRHSLGRFLSIFAIVALGCGFFSGIKATMPDMIETASEYFNEKNLTDVKFMSTIGIKSQDVEAVKKAENVQGAMAGYSKDVFYHYNNQNLVLKIMSYNDSLEDSSPNKLNKLELVEGRFPEKEGECLIEVKATSPATFKIGNTIKISDPDSSRDIKETLSDDEYKIVGIVTSPLYIGHERDSTNVGNGTIVSNVFVPEYDFICDYYTELYVKFKGTDKYEPFSDEYKNAVKNVCEPAEKTFEDSVNARYEKLVSEAEEKISSAKEKAQLIEKYLAFDGKQLSAAELQLNEQVQSSQKQMQAQEEGSAQYYLAKSKLLQAQQAKEIVSDLSADGKDKAVHNKYSAQLEELKKQAEQAENELKNQKAPYYYQFDRFELSSDYSSFYGDSQKIDSISKVFPVFFILVAALVCLTTMTRMVEEQRTQIGTYKAMGYSGTTIAAKYLIYSSVASLTGSCIGSVVGMQVLPAIIYSCYKILYNIPVLKTTFKPDYVLACALVSVVCTAAAVLYACIRELRSQPSQLMRPKPPHSGKRVVLEKIGFIWNRLSFLGKVTLRNLFRYKKRFLMTLIGVAGCTALIVTGFGLKYSIKSIVSKQFSEYFVYDAFVVMNSGGFSEQQLDKKISSIDGIDKYMFTQQSEGTAENGNKTQTASMVVMKTPEEMSDYVKLIDTESGQKIALDDGSAVITEKLADLLKLEPGDDMTVKMNSHKTVNVKIKAVSENYTNHYIYITPDTYKKLYGEEPTYNLSFVNLKENIDENSFKEQLIANDEFYGMSYKSDSSKGFLDSVDSLNAIVVVLIVCAGALAVVVLYNLANINITERIREIATLKVLGFYDKETSEYICRENYISAVFGILLGFGLGKILHHFVVVTSEVDIVMFNRSLVWWAYVLAALMTMAFTVLVNLILHFKLKKVDMVESLKSVE